MSARKRGLGKGLDALLGASQSGRTGSDNAAEPPPRAAIRATGTMP